MCCENYGLKGLTTEDTESAEEEYELFSRSVISVPSAVNFSESILRKGNGAVDRRGGAEFGISRSRRDFGLVLRNRPEDYFSSWEE